MSNNVFGLSVTAETPVSTGADKLAVDASFIQARPLSLLASHVVSEFNKNVQHRIECGVEARLRRAIEMCKCTYTEEEKARLKAENLPPEIYETLTDGKRRAVMAQLGEIFNQPREKTWILRPTPLPTVSDEIGKNVFIRFLSDFMKVCQLTKRVPSPQSVKAYIDNRYDEAVNTYIAESKKRAERMERKIHDQMTEGDWGNQIADYINYITTYGTCIMRGPIVRRKLVTERKTGKLGKVNHTRVLKTVLCIDAINPWDCYPSKGAKQIKDGNLCIRVKYQPSELHEYAKKANLKGAREDGEFFVDSIRSILARNPNGGVSVGMSTLTGEDQLRRKLESDGTANVAESCQLEGVEFFGEIRGNVLLEFGIIKTQDGDSIEYDSYYESNVIVVDNQVIYCKILNPFLGRPLAKGVFYESPDSWWGECIADKLVSTQKIANAALRTLCTNMIFAATPMVGVSDMSRLVDKSPTGLQMKPGKVFAFNFGTMGQNDMPIKPIVLPSHISEILMVSDHFRKRADEDSGIPAFTHGSNVVGGAGRTASGLAMLTEAASRGMKMVVNSTDRHVVREIVKKFFEYNMLFDSDEQIKGDCEIDPSGIMGKLLQEQEANARSMFWQKVNANPVALQIIGAKGIARLLRADALHCGLNPDDLIPSEARLEEIELLQNLQQLNQINSQNGQQGARSPQGVEVSSEEQPQDIGSKIRENPENMALQMGTFNEGGARGIVEERRGAA